jgi:RimJ/RimL family protein N-acetyltransferase
MQEWLARPHVDEWWHEALDLAGVHAKYGPRIDGTEPTHVFVVQCGEQPIGWIQWYRWDDYPEHAARIGADSGSAGIDLAIGEPSLLGLGIGTRAIRLFVKQVVFADPSIVACFSDPEGRNIRSVRAFERAGFVVARTVHVVGEPAPRRILRCGRS